MLFIELSPRHALLQNVPNNYLEEILHISFSAKFLSPVYFPSPRDHIPPNAPVVQILAIIFWESAKFLYN